MVLVELDGRIDTLGKLHKGCWMKQPVARTHAMWAQALDVYKSLVIGLHLSYVRIPSTHTHTHTHKRQYGTSQYILPDLYQ